MKDFGDTIPGHGGVTDRFDCQMIMAMFAYLYYWNYVAAPAATLGEALEVRGLATAVLCVWCTFVGCALQDVCFSAQHLTAHCTWQVLYVAALRTGAGARTSSKYLSQHWAAGAKSACIDMVMCVGCVVDVDKRGCRDSFWAALRAS
jgi:hypothetical protein